MVMALEEVSFYNIIGEEVNLTNLVNQMINYYDLKLGVGETRVTDFNQGSEIRNLLEAFAVLCYSILEDENEAGKLPFIATSYGTYLDRIGENPFINLKRREGNPSQGSVTFTLSAAQSSDIVIPAETVLQDSVLGLTFLTDDDVTISAGDTTGVIGVTCLTDGVDGNIAPGTLTIINDEAVDTNLVSVSNSDGFVNGSDYEDDDVYRERLLANVQSDGFGTLGYYTNLGENVDGVHDVILVDDADYTKCVLVNGDSKPTPDSVLLDVLAAFSDVDNIVLGHNFTVDTPDYVTLNLTFTLDVLTSLDSDDLTALVTAVVNGGAWDRVEFNGLDIGEDLSKDILVEGLSYISDIVSVGVKVTGQSSEFDSTSIDSDEVVKLGTLTFTQNIVG